MFWIYKVLGEQEFHMHFPDYRLTPDNCKHFLKRIITAAFCLTDPNPEFSDVNRKVKKRIPNQLMHYMQQLRNQSIRNYFCYEICFLRFI